MKTLLIILLFTISALTIYTCDDCTQCPTGEVNDNSAEFQLKVGEYAIHTYPDGCYFDTITHSITIPSFVKKKRIKIFEFLKGNMFRYNPWDCVGGCGINKIIGQEFGEFNEGIYVEGTYEIFSDSIRFLYQYPSDQHLTNQFTAKLLEVSDTHFIFLDSVSLCAFNENYDTVLKREIYLFNSDKNKLYDCYLNTETSIIK